MDYVISDLTSGPTTGSFYEKEFEKTNQKDFIIGKIIKRKSDKLYAKWKGCDSRFKSWINKKYIM